jgi:hypothetical protein
MSQFKCNLNHVRVAAPCNVDWDSMFGDERKRFCGQCQLNVYNLSEMTRSEAETLVARSEGRLCVRYYRRRDGSIITQNCPVGLRAIKRRLSRVANAIGSTVLTFFAGMGAYLAADRFSLVSVPYHRGEVMGVMAVEPQPPYKANPMAHSVVTGKIVPIAKMKTNPRKRK